jgi:hypothetical protein
MSTAALIVIIFVVIILFAVLGTVLFSGGSRIPPNYFSQDLRRQLQATPTIYPPNRSNLDYVETYVVGFVGSDVTAMVTTMDCDNVIVKPFGPINNEMILKTTTSNGDLDNDTTMWPYADDRNGIFTYVYRLSILNSILEPRLDHGLRKKLYELQGTNIYMMIFRGDGPNGGRDLIIVDYLPGSEAGDNIKEQAAIAYILLHGTTDGNEVADAFTLISLISTTSYDWAQALRSRWDNLVITPVNAAITNPFGANLKNSNQVQMVSSIAKAIEVEPSVWSTLKFKCYPQSSWNGVTTARLVGNVETKYLEPPLTYTIGYIEPENWSKYTVPITEQ